MDDGGDGGNGGGIYSNGELTLNNCTVTRNYTGNGGDGDIGSGGDNGAGGYGGGIYDATGDASFHAKNTIIAENTVACDGQGPDCSGSLITHGCNLVGDDTACSITPDATTPDATDQVGTWPDTIDPLLGPLQDNGGPTHTHALLLTSPAIDAVSDECGDCTNIGDTPEPIDQDQRGEPRPMDGDGDYSLFCDIGAYEAPLHPFNQGLLACRKAVGGAVEPVDLAELGAPFDDGTGTHIPIVLWIGLASALAIGGGILLLRRQRSN
jgi:hypothetical protein